jgi:hypothetical protein
MFDNIKFEKDIFWLAPIIVIGIGLLPMPYGYYFLSRLVVSGCALYYIIQFYSDKNMEKVFLFGFFAILYNPIIPIHLGDKSLWAIVNIITAIMFFSIAKNYISKNHVSELKNGKRNGQGAASYPDIEKYIGEIEDKAIMFLSIAKNHISKHYVVDKKEDKYVGEFKGGEKNGQGTYTWADGAQYVGEWKDDLRHGQGTISYANGKKYVGEFKDGKRNGQGTFTIPNLGEYIGEYKDDNKHGQGTFTYSDGTKEEGIWEDDEFLG